MDEQTLKLAYIHPIYKKKHLIMMNKGSKNVQGHQSKIKM